MDATQPWARQPKEPTQWYERFQRFLFLGPSRSIHQAYIAERRDKASTKQARVKVEAEISSRSGLPKSWRAQAHKWQWRERADAFDDAERKKRDALYAARADEILTSGFAQRFTRIAELNHLAELLQAELFTEDKRWLPDAKWIGGEFGERVDIVRFNAAVVEQYRQTLEDIAIEMGERKHDVKLSGSIGVAQITADDMARAAAEAKAWEAQFVAQMNAAPPTNDE